MKVRPYRRGGWEVDVTVRLPNGSRWREPLLGSKRLDAITTEHVQNLKRHLHNRAPKTVNNVVGR